MDMGFRRKYLHEVAVEVLGSARGHMGHVRMYESVLVSSCMMHDAAKISRTL